VNRTNYIASYENRLEDPIGAHGESVAMGLIVGEDSEAIGKLEVSVRQTLGLSAHHDLFGVGCGSGRIEAKQVPRLSGRRVGAEVLPSLVSYARRTRRRQDFRYADCRLARGAVEFGQSVCVLEIQ
jgi:hypothetical protein